MARYRDDDDDRDDDRPRRRSRRDDDDDRPPRKQGGGTGVVLLIVGLAVGLPVLICAGLAAYGMFWFNTTVKQAFGSAQAMSAAQGFLGSLSQNAWTARTMRSPPPGIRRR